MPTHPTSIWLALKSRIDTLVPVPAMTVYEPDAVVPGNAPYILTSDVRNTPVRRGVRGKRGLHEFSGTLMLSVHYPISHPASHVQLVQMGGVIADHFPADLRMRHGDVCLRVTQEPDVSQPYRQDNNRVVVVRVPWSTV